jgi:mannose-6-phosphate isomerase-like protein (cupin superfamily)
MPVLTTAGTPGIDRFTSSQLLRTARLFATDPELHTLVDLEAAERQWRRLDATPHLEIWLLSWPSGARTGWHDHHDSEGAFVTARGSLTETTWSADEVRDRDLGAGEGRSFGRRHIHDVANLGTLPTLSVHVYSPALTRMTRYAVAGDRLERTGVERAGENW